VPTVLVTGADGPGVTSALERVGVTPVVIGPDEDLADGLSALTPGSLAGYVQLPVAVEVSGNSVLVQVRTFLRDGLLHRFDQAELVLPYLSGRASVVLVSGNTPVQAGGGDARLASDDKGARASMLRVLAHTIRLDRGGEISVGVVDGRKDSAAIARALQLGPEGPSSQSVVMDDDDPDTWGSEDGPV
jgi:hypothetical protein